YGHAACRAVPLWAAHWIVAGHDGDHLAELAGLHGDDPREVRDLLPAALVECDVPAADLTATTRNRRRAAAMTAIPALARLLAAGRASERWVADKAVEIAAPDYDEEVLTLPLGHLVGLEDEWAAGWGRTDEELRNLVRQRCREQLRAASSQPGAGKGRHPGAGGAQPLYGVAVPLCGLGIRHVDVVPAEDPHVVAVAGVAAELHGFGGHPGGSPVQPDL